MRVAIIGSRTLQVNNLEDYLPKGVTAIISGGAKGIDQCAAKYAKAHGIKLIEYYPDYARYGRSAPLQRNKRIVEACDMVLAFWDKSSKGTKFTIDYATKMGKRVCLIDM